MNWRVVTGAHSGEPIALVGANTELVDYRVIGRNRWLFVAWLDRLGDFWCGGNDGARYFNALRDLEHDYQ